MGMSNISKLLEPPSPIVPIVWLFLGVQGAMVNILMIHKVNIINPDSVSFALCVPSLGVE